MTHVGRKISAALAVLIILGMAAAWRLQSGNGNPVPLRTSPITRGDLLVSSRATGTIEPEEVVDVGAQVAGRIVAFGNDVDHRPVDYGSLVEAGTVLARIDDSIYAADVAQNEAQVRSAEAAITRTEADLEQLRAKLFQAEQEWRRAERLGPSEALSMVSFDAYQAAYRAAGANVAVGEASILQAKAGRAQAEAALRRARQNLGYCTIKSPVKGVIIDRRVNIGQTVVASLNAPSLFLIAKDLTRIQVWVAVNEADIGKIHSGQPVTFTVDAFPGETFRGVVGKVRLNAAMSQNVVTYTVEIATDNADGRLLPYLTANVEFELERRREVLQVPNAALRWTPPAEIIAPEFRESDHPRDRRPDPGNRTRPEPSAGTPPPDRERSADQAFLWLPHGKYVRPVGVTTGRSDGVTTQIEGEGLEEGTMVVTGTEVKPAAREKESGNPFAPQFARPGRNSGAR